MLLFVRLTSGEALVGKCEEEECNSLMAGLDAAIELSQVASLVPIDPQRVAPTPHPANPLTIGRSMLAYCGPVVDDKLREAYQQVTLGIVTAKAIPGNGKERFRLER
jgi:hypothetical protein